MKINQDLIYRWTLRFKYIWLFFLGAIATALGLESLFLPGRFTLKAEINIFVGCVATFLGIVIIIIGFYRKKQIEHFITKHNL